MFDDGVHRHYEIELTPPGLINAESHAKRVNLSVHPPASELPDILAAAEYIEKTWAHSKSKGFESPAAHERTRETPRRRC